jgi:chromosome segregation ATPase
MAMSKVGRNEPCPCGSGKKFKRCCSERVETQERLERQRAEHDRLAAERERLEAARELAEARLAEARAAAAEFEEKDRLSAEVLRLIAAEQFDEAEGTAHQLEARFPGDTAGVERLAQVYEAKGQPQAATDEYRRGVAMMDALGDGHFCDCCRARMVKAVWRLDPDGPALVLGRDPQ